MSRSSVTIGLRSGGSTQAVEPEVGFYGGAIHLHCHVPHSPVVEAMEATRQYAWTLYGSDGLPIFNVEAVPIDCSEPWPSDATLTFDQRVDVDDPDVSRPTSVRIVGGL